MAQQVDIPGLGIVEFPDGMSDNDIATAIKKNIMPTLPATSTASSAGRTAAGFADTVLGGPAALANMVGYAGARALGKSPEQAKKAEIFETQPLAKAFGVGQSPEYRSEASQRFGAFVGENIGKGAKWISDNTGLPVADVENMIGTMAAGAGVKTAPLANKAIGLAGQAAERGAIATAKGVTNTAKSVAELPNRVAEGAIAGTKAEPSFSKAISEDVLQQARDTGVVGPKGEASVRLAGNTVPVQGKLPEAMAENVVRGLLGKDGKQLGMLQGGADIAGMFGIGLPFQGSAIKALLPATKAWSPLRTFEGVDGRPAFVNKAGEGIQTGEPLVRSVQDLESQLASLQGSPKPVLGSTTPDQTALPAPEPVAKSFGQTQLEALKAKLQKSQPVDEKGPGKREQNAANKEMKQMMVDTTIADVVSGDVDAFAKHNITTHPIDVTDMSNATKGYYRMIKEKVGGAFDSMPDTTWLNDHGLTEQAYIQRVWREVMKQPRSPKSESTPALPAPVPEQKALPAPTVGENDILAQVRARNKSKAEASVAQSLGIPESMVPKKK